MKFLANLLKALLEAIQGALGLAKKGLNEVKKRGWLGLGSSAGQGATPNAKDNVSILDRKIENGHVFDLSEIGLEGVKLKEFAPKTFLETLDKKISKEKNKDNKKHMQFILDKCNSTMKGGGSIEMLEAGKIKFNIKEDSPEERHENKGPAAREVKAGDLANSLSGLSDGQVSKENVPVKEQRKRDLGRDFRGLGATKV